MFSKKLQNSRFHKMFSPTSHSVEMSEILPQAEEWKLQDFTATILLQKFRQINFFTQKLYSKLI